ncbi:MAG: BON domain-containing protein [Candidatus Obscuribacterales bacterium]|nr:BON domain-containing protein [Candidatus Obscuribacterales bacterium]
MRIFASAAALFFLLVSANAQAEAKAPKADNTAQNQGATQPDAVNADKQAMDNKKSDVQVLAEVRKSIMAEKELSTDAKNCKLRYMKDGKLILRGPVDSDQEKTKVAELAAACSGVTTVQNELTVAPKAH